MSSYWMSFDRTPMDGGIYPNHWRLQLTAPYQNIDHETSMMLSQQK